MPGVGVPQRPDDPTIDGSQRLWRRVHPIQIRIDPETEDPEISSGVFSTDQELSVALASETTIETLLGEYPEYSVVEFEAVDARSTGCTVVRCPLPGDPAHALVCGPRSRGRLNKTQQQYLKTHSRLVVFRRPKQRG